MNLAASSVMVEVSGLEKKFKNTKAVNGVDFKIYEGEFVALLGPNGAGKTTLVEMIEGLQKPDKGAILIQSMQWQGQADQIRKIMGISLQETRFYEKITVAETVQLFGSFYGKNKTECQQILMDVGLEAKVHDYTVKLSGGQRQKLALAIALINEPRVLILDEPTTGLDPHSRREIWHILMRLKKKKTTLILTTHYMEEAQFLCERILIMFGGKIIAQGDLNSLLRENNCNEVIEFDIKQKINLKIFSSLLKNRALGSAEIKMEKKENYYRVQIKIDDLRNQLSSFMALVKKHHLVIENLQCRKMNLDDLFIALTGKHLQESA